MLMQLSAAPQQYPSKVQSLLSASSGDRKRGDIGQEEVTMLMTAKEF